MGIMENKVTRRIALGSIAGGLGGAALVMSALKSRYRVKLPEKEYVTEWDKRLKIFAVPISQVDGPPTFTLNLRPQVGLRFRVISFSSSVHGTSSKNYSDLPTWYTLTDRGRVTVIPPIIDGRPTLEVAAPAQTENWRWRQQTEERSGGTCTVVWTSDGVNGRFEYYETDRGALRKLGPGEVNATCAKIATGLFFGYPAGKPLATGAKWVIPPVLVQREMETSIVGLGSLRC
jgi:hypothetical protein